MNNLKLNELIALIHYKKDFKHINPLFNSIGLRVDEINGELVISDLQGNKVSTIKSRKYYGGNIMFGKGYNSVHNDFILESDFEYNGNKISYQAEVDDHGRHQTTLIKVRKGNKTYSVNVSTPIFSEFGMRIEEEGEIHKWDHINMSRDNLNVAKSTENCLGDGGEKPDGAYRFMDIGFPNKPYPNSDWVMPFNMGVNYNSQISFMHHTDQPEEYFVNYHFDKEPEQKSITSSTELFNYCVNQAIASDLAQGFLGEVFGDFEEVFSGIKTIARNTISGFNDIVLLAQENSGSNRNEKINQYVSTFGKNQTPLFESEEMNLPLSSVKKMAWIDKRRNS